MAVIIFIVILGVLVFVHELGHFVTARRNGIRADEFGFGFPPRIVGIQFMSKQEKTKEKNPFKKWRIIWGSKDGDDKNEKKDLAEAHEKKFAGGTIYSLNWLMLGGFVRIKGEDGENKKDSDSFASKSAWVRVKVLAAGVLMNFVLAWFLISIVLTLGAPQQIDPSEEKNINSKIQISSVLSQSPAEESGLKIGDEVLRDQKNSNGQEVKIETVKELQDFINFNRGQKIELNIKRGKQDMKLEVSPRINTPEGEGPLGVSLAQTAIVKYSWYESIWEGLKTTLSLIGAILVAFFGIIKNLFLGNGVGADVAGPVGIAVLTRDVAGLGLVYVLQFAALLSINLGIINIMPIPALDGGRILFVMIEKIKGSPVSQKIEQTFHSIGFLLLVILLVLITFKDVVHYVK